MTAQNNGISQTHEEIWAWKHMNRIIYENDDFYIFLESVGFVSWRCICFDCRIYNKCNYDLRIRNKLILINGIEQKIEIRKRKHNKKIRAQSEIIIRYGILADDNDVSYKLIYEVSKDKSTKVLACMLLEMQFNKRTHDFRIKKIKDIYRQT